MLEIADAVPDLKAYPSAPWTEANLKGSCEAAGLALGVKCASDNSGFVVEIDVFLNNMAGSLPNSIGGLTALKTLHLSCGPSPIPASIINTSLTSFTSLATLTGPIPKMPST